MQTSHRHKRKRHVENSDDIEQVEEVEKVKEIEEVENLKENGSTTSQESEKRSSKKARKNREKDSKRTEPDGDETEVSVSRKSDDGRIFRDSGGLSLSDGAGTFSVDSSVGSSNIQSTTSRSNRIDSSIQRNAIHDFNTNVADGKASSTETIDIHSNTANILLERGGTPSAPLAVESHENKSGIRGLGSVHIQETVSRATMERLEFKLHNSENGTEGHGQGQGQDVQHRGGQAPNTQFPIAPLALTTNTCAVLVMEDLIDYCMNINSFCSEILDGKMHSLATPQWFRSQADLLMRWNAFHYTEVFHKQYGSGSSRLMFDCTLPALMLYSRIILLAACHLKEKDASWIGTPVDKKIAQDSTSKQIKLWTQWFVSGRPPVTLTTTTPSATGASSSTSTSTHTSTSTPFTSFTSTSSAFTSPEALLESRVKLESQQEIDFWDKERLVMDKTLSQILILRFTKKLLSDDFKYLEKCARLMYWVDLQLFYLKTREIKEFDANADELSRLQYMLDEHMSFEPAADMYGNFCNFVYAHYLPAGAKFIYLQNMESLGGRKSSDRASSLAMVMEVGMDDTVRKGIHTNINLIDSNLNNLYKNKAHPFWELFMIRLFGDYLKERKRIDFFDHYFIGVYDFPSKHVLLSQDYREEIGLKHKRAPLFVNLLGKWYISRGITDLYQTKNVNQLMATWIYCLLTDNQGELEDGFAALVSMCKTIIK